MFGTQFYCDYLLKVELIVWLYQLYTFSIKSLFLIIRLISDKHKQFCCWSDSKSEFCLSCVRCVGFALFNLIKAAVHSPTFTCWNDLGCHFIWLCLGHKHEEAPFPSSSSMWPRDSNRLVHNSDQIMFGESCIFHEGVLNKVVLFY